MEELNQLQKKYVWARGAIDVLGEDLALLKCNAPDNRKYKLMRNGIVHNYVMLLYTFWKFLKLYLDVVHKVSVEPIPKKIFIAAADCGVIKKDDAILFFSMIDDCSCACFTYHEVLAQELIERISTYHQVLHNIMYKEIKVPHL
jgi:hypothetical protein